MASNARLSDLAVLARIALHIWVANFSFCSLCSCYYHQSSKRAATFPRYTSTFYGHNIFSRPSCPSSHLLVFMFPTKHISVDTNSNILSSCKTPNWKLKLFSGKSSPKVYHEDFSPVWSDRWNIRRGKSVCAAAVTAGLRSQSPPLCSMLQCCSVMQCSVKLGVRSGHSIQDVCCCEACSHCSHCSATSKNSLQNL